MKYQETGAKWVRAGLFTPDSVSSASSKGKKSAAIRRPATSKAPQLLRFPNQRSNLHQFHVVRRDQQQAFWFRAIVAALPGRRRAT